MDILPDTIYISEIFSAIQGEGALIGHRQIFVRLSGCNIRCTYCDQPEALEKKPGQARVEATAGKRDWEIFQSPMPISQVIQAVEKLGSDMDHHSISFTGGEPLFQALPLAQLASALHPKHHLYLETNGTLPKRLEKVLPWMDIIAMDIKLNSVDGQQVDKNLHYDFLSLARQKDVFIKIVLGKDTDENELIQYVSMVQELTPQGEIYLQPLTPFGQIKETISVQKLLDLQEMALKIHDKVRVVPQTHKFINQL